MLELSNEDTLRLNVLINTVEAIRIGADGTISARRGDGPDVAIGIWGAPFVAQLERACAALDARQAGPQLGLWGGK